MKNKIMMTAFLSVLSTSAFAANIVWDDAPSNNRPAYNSSSYNDPSPVFDQSYKTDKAPAFGQYHENLNYEGNAHLNSADIKKLQRALSARGFYKGKVDGLWGGQTSQAILDFQGATNQALTGTVTAETLSDLGVKIDARKY